MTWKFGLESEDALIKYLGVEIIGTIHEVKA